MSVITGLTDIMTEAATAMMDYTSYDPSLTNGTNVTTKPLSSENTTAKEFMTQLEWSCLEYRFVMSFLFGMVMTVGGIIGNGLATFTFWPNRNTNSTKFLLITLAFYDTVLLIIWFLVLSVPAMCKFGNICEEYTKWIHPVVRAYVLPLGSMSHMAGAWNIVGVAIFRYIAACHPHKNKHLTSIKNARIFVAVISVTAFVFYIPWLTEKRIDYNADHTALVSYYSDLMV